MSGSGPLPPGLPNQMNPPPLSHEPQKGLAGSLSLRWFLLGFLLVLLVLAGITWLSVTSDLSGELEYAQFEEEVRQQNIYDLVIENGTMEGKFRHSREAYDGVVIPRDAPPLDGFTRSQAQPVVSFTMEIPEGRQDEVIATASRHSVSVTLE